MKMEDYDERLVWAKRALACDDAEVNVDAEWHRFRKSNERTLLFPLRKLAAVFVGVLLLSGIAVAAGLVIADFKSATREAGMTQARHQSRQQDAGTVSVPTDTLALDTTVLAPVVTFDDVRLDSMLMVMGEAYGWQVEYRSEASRALRLYLEWSPQMPADSVVLLLNGFEKINLELNHETLTVR